MKSKIVTLGDTGRGNIRLRWRYKKKRYSICLGEYTPENITTARIKASQIEIDILRGVFDTTLGRYKDLQQPRFDWLQRFDLWVVTVRNIDLHQSNHYLYIRKMLAKWGLFEVYKAPELLQKMQLGPATYNERLSTLSKFFDWLLLRKEIPTNTLNSIQRRRKPSKIFVHDKRSPLTSQQISSILEAVLTNRFCHPSSAYKHSHYYPFLCFVFHTGVRNAEAVGLRVKHVDLHNRIVRISEVLARSIDGAHAKVRVRKETKTGNTRLLPLSDRLFDILKTVTQGKDPEDLVFQSYSGKAIDDRMLQRRVLNPILMELKIDPRNLYAARHSFGSRAIDQGMSPLDVAYLMGHSSVETTMRNYVKPIHLPITLPSIEHDIRQFHKKHRNEKG
jgi:integrase